MSRKKKPDAKTRMENASKVPQNFYPTYVDGNRDKVTPAAATFKTHFQTVIPRYNLSMTETRNEGTGPTFLETEYQPHSGRQETVKKTEEQNPETSEPLSNCPA